MRTRAAEAQVNPETRARNKTGGGSTVEVLPVSVVDYLGRDHALSARRLVWGG